MVVTRCFKGTVERRSVPDLPDDLTVIAAQALHDRLKVINRFFEIIRESPGVNGICRRLAVAPHDDGGELAGDSLVTSWDHTHKVNSRTWHARSQPNEAARHRTPSFGLRAQGSVQPGFHLVGIDGRISSINMMSRALTPLIVLPFGALIDAFGVGAVVAAAGVALVLAISLYGATHPSMLREQPH